MRSEREMMHLILSTAENESRIRAVVLNGSRANPNAPKDNFQDYDIVYVVDDISYFEDNFQFIDTFGKRIMLQMPEKMCNPVGDGRLTYLMLFEDGNRIDLQIIPATKLELLENSTQTIVLLDKDDALPPFLPASDKGYHIGKPTELEYNSCCNNFWWTLQNVAKGIARTELPYAMEMYHTVTHPELNHMVKWYIGVKNGFSVSAGKMGKYYKDYLNDQEYQMYCNAYGDGNLENFWNTLFSVTTLFRTLAKEVGQKLGYSYNESDDENMEAYLQKVKSGYYDN